MVIHRWLHGNSPLAVGYRQYIASQENGEAEEHGWHPNTHLGVDVKTLLRSDVRMVVGNEYQGIFRLDSEGIADEFLCRDPHFTFSLRLNFKELPKGANFNLERFALGVYNELCLALGGLIEEGE